MPHHIEYKFVTTRPARISPAQGDASYYNWADVSEMLTRYGAEGWRISQMSGTKVGDDSVLYAFVLERAVSSPLQRHPK